MKAVTITSLRNKLKSYFDTVSKTQDIIFVARNNNEDDAVVIMSIKDFNSLNETAHLLSTEANRKHLEESIHELRAGKTIAYDFNKAGS